MGKRYAKKGNIIGPERRKLLIFFARDKGLTGRKGGELVELNTNNSSQCLLEQIEKRKKKRP